MKKRIMKNVLCFTSSGGRLKVHEAEEDPPEASWERVLELLGEVKVGLVDLSMKIADYKTGGGIAFIEPPSILGNQEFFQAPRDPSDN